MHVFSISFNSVAAGHQTTIMNRLRSEGYQVMAVNNGVLAKIAEGTKSVPESLGDLAEEVTVNMFHPSLMASDYQLTREARIFAGI